jgi:hypothetical protein
VAVAVAEEAGAGLLRRALRLQTPPPAGLRAHSVAGGGVVSEASGGMGSDELMFHLIPPVNAPAPSRSGGKPAVAAAPGQRCPGVRRGGGRAAAAVAAVMGCGRIVMAGTATEAVSTDLPGEAPETRGWYSWTRCAPSWSPW